MTMKNDEKIEDKLTHCFKTGMNNLTNFDPRTQRSKMYEFEIYRVVMCRDNEE